MDSNQTYRLNVGVLQSVLRQKLVTRETFKLPFSKADVYEALLIAVQIEVEFRHKEFIINEALQLQLKQMADWLTCDKHKFGMLLCGKCGNGKTTLVRAFQNLLNSLQLRNEHRGTTWGIRIMDAREIASLAKNNDQAWRELCRVQMLAIDDLGTEPLEVLDFGNVLNPVVDLLTKRYNEQLFTIITTNLMPEQIKEKYGERIADRFKEMMEKIAYTNDTYRGIKRTKNE